MLTDLGGSLMVASAHRHCLAIETIDIVISEEEEQVQLVMKTPTSAAVTVLV